MKRRTLLLVAIGCVITIEVVLFAGPLVSGGAWLLLPTAVRRLAHDLPESYEPLHKGGIDLGTGLYVRRDEDLVVAGTPALILRRTYLSEYRVSRQFGVGTTHDGEWYLIGDGGRFQWAELILADGARIRFERTSPGTSYLNAMYEHRATPGEWQGARLGWTGVDWAIRLTDGSVARFQPCGPGTFSECAITLFRDVDGHVIEYRRDGKGRLKRMEAGKDRWIEFEYDGQDRIERASDSGGHSVRYEYDAQSRLITVKADSGRQHRYTYTDRDEMATIADPEIAIENTYENGRCIRQVNRLPEGTAPYVFDFAFRIEQGRVVQTDTKESDGTWSRYTWAPSRHQISETHGEGNVESASFTYERDPITNVVTALTLTCADRTGRPLRHSSAVGAGYEDWIKWDMLRTHCWWNGHRWPTDY